MQGKNRQTTHIYRITRKKSYIDVNSTIFIGLWNLFKGYAFFRMVGAGIVLVFFGIIITGLAIHAGEFCVLVISISFLLLGTVLLYFAHNIWLEEKYRNSTAERYE